MAGHREAGVRNERSIMGLDAAGTRFRGHPTGYPCPSRSPHWTVFYPNTFLRLPMNERRILRREGETLNFFQRIVWVDDRGERRADGRPWFYEDLGYGTSDIPLHLDGSTPFNPNARGTAATNG